MILPHGGLTIIGIGQQNTLLIRRAIFVTPILVRELMMKLEKVIQDLLKETGAKDVSPKINNPTYQVQTKNSRDIFRI